MFAKIILLFCLIFSFTLFFYYLKKSGVIGRKIRELNMVLDEAAVKRTREWKKNVGVERTKSTIEKILEKPERRFIYSGIANKFPGVTIEIWLIIIILSSAFVYILAFLFLKDLIKSIIAVCAYIAVIEFVESCLILKNYKAVDDEMLKFLDMLGNFSIANGEITSVFSQVARFLKDPLKTELEECYYEAYTSGNSKEALEVLADKIEHPRFKEIIRNILICIDYSANYREVVSNSRKIVLEEQRARKERKAVANEAVVNMFLISIMCLFSLQIVNQLIDRSIWNIILNTVVGNISAVAIGAIYLFFAWKVWTVDK